MNCKYCNKVTNGNFGNGKFCDKHCARAFKRQKVAEPLEEKKEIFIKKKKVKKEE